MKKFLALILALVTLMSMMVIPSFAATPLPEVESVKFIDDNAISLKEMTAYFDEMLEWYEEDGSPEMIEEEYFYLNYAMIDYEIEVAFSDGNTEELSLSDSFLQTDSYEVYADAYVSYAEYLEAKNNKAKTVDVEISVTVDNTTLAFYGESVTTDFVVEKAVKNAYVLSILPLNFLPTKIYRNCDYFDLDGTKFLVTYSDLNTETLELSYDKDMYEYYLGDEYIDLYISEDDELTFSFYDEVFTKKVIVEDEPFEKIEIKECDFDASSKTLSSIKCDVTLKDGTVKSFAKTFDEATEIDSYYVVGEIEGFYVFVIVMDYELSENGTTLTDNFCITAEVGYGDDEGNYVTDTYRVKNPLGFITQIRMFFEMIVEWFSEFIFTIIFGAEVA
ncbi:MAG: hypothetical protein IJM97_01450 [Clostridia bacterium]|nr:hypothetical protein [Clostridia bacterium]